MNYKYLSFLINIFLSLLPAKMLAATIYVDTVEGYPVEYITDNNNAIVKSIRTYKNVPDGQGYTMVEITSSTITIPQEIVNNNTTYVVNKIADNALSGKTQLIEIKLPETITYIGNNAFYECTALQKINIPNAVNDIGNQAFMNCISLLAITIPSSVTKVRYNTFYGCSALLCCYPNNWKIFIVY